MIYPLAGLMLGAILGPLMAVRRGGNAKDMAQWGAVMAIMFGLIGLFILIFIERSYV